MESHTRISKTLLYNYIPFEIYFRVKYNLLTVIREKIVKDYPLLAGPCLPSKLREHMVWEKSTELEIRSPRLVFALPMTSCGTLGMSLAPSNLTLPVCKMMDLQRLISKGLSYSRVCGFLTFSFCKS